MMNSTEESISKIPTLKHYGRQNLDFIAWITLFATSIGQKYGELAQVFRIGDTFEYTAPPTLHESVINVNTEAEAMQRTMKMEQVTEHRKSKLSQNNTNIQLYSKLYNKLQEDTCKKLIDDPLWAEVERRKDPKGLTKIMMLA